MSIMRPPQYPLLGLLPADVPQNFGYVIDAAQRHRRCAETGACTGQIFSRTSFQLFVTANAAAAPRRMSGSLQRVIPAITAPVIAFTLTLHSREAAGHCGFTPSAGMQRPPLSVQGGSR